ncbi:MAG: hypothetical protein ACI89L_000652 [Phycisphaerales bacterium]|jgi:hypothetical protein
MKRMTEIRSISESTAARLDREPTPPARQIEAKPTVRRGDDRVEVSEVARLLNRLRGEDYRPDLVTRVRGEIEQGVYESPDKIDAAVESAIDDLSQ